MGETYTDWREKHGFSESMVTLTPAHTCMRIGYSLPLSFCALSCPFNADGPSPFSSRTEATCRGGSLRLDDASVPTAPPLLVAALSFVCLTVGTHCVHYLDARGP